jgi:hypothetical protein
VKTIRPASKELGLTRNRFLSETPCNDEEPGGGRGRSSINLTPWCAS